MEDLASSSHRDVQGNEMHFELNFVAAAAAAANLGTGPTRNAELQSCLFTPLLSCKIIVELIKKTTRFPFSFPPIRIQRDQ